MAIFLRGGGDGGFKGRRGIRSNQPANQNMGGRSSGGEGGGQKKGCGGVGVQSNVCQS